MLSDCESRGKASWSGQAVRWWYVARYYRTSQLAMRLIRLLERKSIRIGGGRRYVRLPRSRVAIPVLPRWRGASSPSEGLGTLP